MNPKAIVFDAYGTLLDVHSVIADEALSRLWRQKQLEYTWLRALMERYEDFRDVTEAALRAACAQLKIAASEEQIERLMQAYLRPAAFADARVALERHKGSRMAILSNGTSKMLQASIRHNGLESYFEEIISVERVKTYKPSPRVYALGPEVLKTPAGDILFVSSNAWDAAGAKAYGYRVCWCNRAGAEMERLGFAPDMTVTRLDEMEAS
jgi:2-haloacid dehalogenase